MSAKCIQILIILLLLARSVYAQVSYEDLYQNLWEVHQDSTSGILSKMYAEIERQDFEQGRTMWYKLIEKGKLKNNSNLMIQVCLEAERYFFSKKKFIDDSEVITTLTTYTQKNQLKKDEGEAYITIANRYLNAYLYDKALEYYLKALLIFEKTKDNQSIYKTYYGIGNAFYRTDPQKSRTYMLKSLQYKNYFDNPINYISSINTIGLTYQKEKDYDNAIVYFEMALEAAIQYKDIGWQGIINGNIGGVLFEKKEYQKSLYHFFKELKFVKDEIDIVFTYLLIAKNYTMLKQFDNAKAYLDSSKISNSANKDIFFLRTSIQVHKLYYEMINDFEKAYQYAEKFAFYADSINNIKQKSKLEEIKSQYDFTKQTEQLELLNQKTKLQALNISKQRWIIYMILSIIVILLLLFYLQIIYNRKIKKLNVKLNLQQEEISTQNEELKQQQDNLADLNNVLEKELKTKQALIETKNKEILNYALYMAENNEFLGDLKKNILDLSISPNEIKPILSKIDTAQSKDKDWENFRLMFEAVNPDFFKYLIAEHPQLTAQELKLCALIKLNLSSKEIASILSIASESVYKARYRIRKKMNIDSEDSLNDMLFRL